MITMEGINERRKVIMEIAIAIALPIFVFAAIYMWQSGGMPNIDENGVDQNETRSAKVREALRLVERINPLSDKIFRSAEWETLVDYTPEIPTVPLGRENPFTRPEGLNVAPQFPQVRGPIR